LTRNEVVRFRTEQIIVNDFPAFGCLIIIRVEQFSRTLKTIVCLAIAREDGNIVRVLPLPKLLPPRVRILFRFRNLAMSLL